MKKIILCCALATCAFSCSENKRTVIKETETIDANGNTSTEKATYTDSLEKPEKRNGININLTNIHIRIFSNPAKPDTFKLVMQGRDILNNKAHFTITNAQGKIIHDEIITAPDLEASMVYEMKSPKATPAEREKFVRNRFDTFFHEEQFSTPAIAPNDIYDPSFGNEQAWNAIKKDTSSVGFNYLLGKENGRRIAYSNLLKKVMTVGYFGG